MKLHHIVAMFCCVFVLTLLVFPPWEVKTANGFYLSHQFLFAELRYATIALPVLLIEILAVLVSGCLVWLLLTIRKSRTFISKT